MTTSPFPQLPRPGGKTPVIAQIIPAMGAGGAEQGCIDTAIAIAQGGGKSIVISHGGLPGRMRELVRAGAIHIDLPVHTKNPWSIWRNIYRLEKLFRAHEVDIAHVRSRAPAWSVMEACKRAKVHFVTTCHAPYATGNGLKRAYNSAIACGERVVAISHFVADYLRAEYGVNDDRLRVIHNGIALERFQPAAVTPDRIIKIAQEWRVPDGATVVLLPGRLTRWKGQHVLIDALADLNRPDVFAVMVGADQGREEYRAELQDHIRNAGLEGRVRIADHTDDLAAAYMLSHVVVSPSIEPEGFGRIAVEGQAMGRMVIATDHGGSRETIIPGVTGWLVPPGDAHALAQALNHALSLDLAGRATIGHNALMHVVQHFGRETMMAAHIELYHELLMSRAAHATAKAV